MKLQHYFTIVACLAIFASCDIKNVPSKDFWIDNPTNAPISVTIDETQHDIPSNTGVYVNLVAGRHKLAYNHEVVNFFVKPNDQACVINPTLSTYVFHHEFYSEIGKEAKSQAEIEKIEGAYLYDFELADGSIIKVPFQLIKDELFIEQYKYYWHLFITEAYKERTTINKGSSNLSAMNRSKLFRENDYLDFLGRENLPEGFSFGLGVAKLSDLKPFMLVEDTLSLDCKSANDYLGVYRKRFNNFIHANAEAYKVTYDSLRYYTSFPQEVERECSPRYNSEVKNPEFDRVMVSLGQRLEALGAMNAFVVSE